MDDWDELEKLARCAVERIAWGEVDMGAWGGEADVEGVDGDGCACRNVEDAMASVRRRVARELRSFCTRSRTAGMLRKGVQRTRRREDGGTHDARSST